MQLTETQELKLRNVLDQLVAAYTASAEELSATHGYIFGELVTAPFFTDKELFETVVYLREMVVAKGLTDLDAVLHYYDNRKHEMREYLMKVVNSDLEADGEPLIVPEKACELRLADNESVKPDEVDHLAEHISTDASQLFEELYVRTLQFFESAPLRAEGEKDVHRAVKRHVRELGMVNQPISMEWQSVETILPRSIQYYVEQFASDVNGERFLVMQFGKFSVGKSALIAGFLKKGWAQVCRHIVRQHAYGGPPPDYEAIMNVIRREEQITDYHFKIQVTEWLVYSKFIASDCRVVDERLEPLSRSEWSLKHLFTGTPVRLYSRTTMHYWIRSLFDKKLSLKKWVILKCRPGQFWLTSDNPGFLINLNELNDEFTEFVPRHSLLDIRPDSVLYYPLSKEYCLRLEPPVEVRDVSRRDIPIDYVTPPDEEQEFVNGMTVSTYKKVVITNQRKTLQEIQL
jgi:hypothetical protein